MYFAYIVFPLLCLLFLKIHTALAPLPPGPYYDQSDTGGAQQGLDAMSSGGAQHPDREDSIEYYEDRLAQIDSHTFVSLIEIAFNDSSKKTCTGAIISDHAVITAAHCFTTRKEHVEAELTLSFVILGTKKMIETGYEMYLPIERIVTHPDFKGWTADLALIFTFSGLVSDMPGTAVPLAGERSSTPVDSNVTVFSWGKCNNDGGMSTHRPEENDGNDKDTASGGDDAEEAVTEVIRGPTQIRANMKVRPPAPTFDPKKVLLRSSHASKPYHVLRAQKRHLRSSEGAVKEIGSRYLTDEDADDVSEENIPPRSRNKRSPGLQIYGFDQNKRRVMEPTKNELTVEVFGFVNAQTCKKLLDRSVDHLYRIENKNEILCYASEGHYITDEDSGAPALQHGKLVAVTVGGVETDGEHVAIGMKMSCFCSWILENLLVIDANINIKCCKNCCETKHANNNTERDSQYRALRKRTKQKLRMRREDEEYENDDEEEPSRHERGQRSRKQYTFVPDYYNNVRNLKLG